MKGVKLLMVSTIAKGKFFMKMLVDGVILFGFPKAKTWEGAAAGS